MFGKYSFKASMKNKLCVIVFVVSFCLATKADAQEKIKRFCEITFYPSGNFFQIDYGQTKKTNPFKDSTFIKKIKGLEGIHNLIKGLNYMTDLGWKYETNIPYDTGFRIEVLFSREFMPDELNNDIK